AASSTRCLPFATSGSIIPRPRMRRGEGSRTRPMRVWLNGSTRGRRIDRSALRRRTRAILGALGCPDGELSVSLIGDAEIAELAGRYGRPHRPTDVLAFSMLEGPGAIHRGAALGDVVISVDTAERQARRRGVSLDDEL